MSQGKYSPALDKYSGPCIFNWLGEVCPDFDGTVPYDEKVHFGNYDKDGYDSYGYSAFDENRNYVGIGNGIDRNGYTEMEYLNMSADEYENIRY